MGLGGAAGRALDEQADDDGEEADTFDEGGGDDRHTTDVVGRLGLAGDRLGGARRDPPDAHAGADGRDAGPDAGAHEARAPELFGLGGLSREDQGDEKVTHGVLLFSFLVFFGHGQAGEDGREHGEDVGLDEGDQHLEQHDEEDEAERGDGRRDAEGPRVGVLDSVEEAEQHQQDGVAPRHVGEQTDGQGEGLGEEPDDLDHEHERYEEPRRAGGHEMDPVPDRALGGDARPLDHDEGDQRQRPGHGQVAGGGALPGVERERGQPDHVREQDEEEQRPEEGQELPAPLVAEPGVDDLVPDPHQGELDEGDDARPLRLRLDLPGRHREDHDREQGDHADEDLVGGDPPGQLVVEEVVDDVDGAEERHTAPRAVPREDGLNDRSTTIISTPR